MSQTSFGTLFPLTGAAGWPAEDCFRGPRECLGIGRLLGFAWRCASHNGLLIACSVNIVHHTLTAKNGAAGPRDEGSIGMRPPGRKGSWNRSSCHWLTQSLSDACQPPTSPLCSSCANIHSTTSNQLRGRKEFDGRHSSRWDSAKYARASLTVTSMTWS